MTMAAAPLLNPPLHRPFPVNSPVMSFPKRSLCLPMRPRSSLSASYNDFPSSDQAVLEAVANFDANEHTLPAVRTFENDLARLTLVGPVESRQALTAAAADGGGAADEHLSSGLDAMVVETVYPGPFYDHSTVTTRLFLPTRKVKERALKLKKSLKQDMLKGTTSKNILAMTFRQVVLQQLWSLELALFSPGSERNMENLENPREVPLVVNLTSSDERVISEIAEVVCTAALECTERHFLPDSGNKVVNWFFSLLNKHKQIISRDFSVVLCNLLEHEILANAKTLLQKFTLERGKNKLKGTKVKHSWWTSLAFSKLEKIGGQEFCSWISECVPSYLLVIDANKLSNVKFEGWKSSKENQWEVVLTHSQMVNLADILDMYYEDIFTLPDKRLSCYAVVTSSDLVLNKGSSLFKMLAIILISGTFLVAISVVRKLYMHRLPVGKSYIQETYEPLSSEDGFRPCHSVEPSEVEACCVSIIQRIKDTFGWPGEVRVKSNVCAWVGEPPAFVMDVGDSTSMMSGISSNSPLGTSEEDKKVLEEIASYQVMVSTDRKIIGFQPTNRVAVNNWASNPLAQDLYDGKKLCPGLLEPGLKMRNSTGALSLVLLMSSNPNCPFALVRTFDISDNN